MEKTNITDTFRDLDILSPRTIGMGRHIIMTSVTTLTTASAMKRAFRSRHSPPSTGFMTAYAFEKGLHTKSIEKKMIGE